MHGGGRLADRWPQHLRPNNRCRAPARARGHGVSETQSFPKSIYDNVAYGPRIYGLADDRATCDEIVVTSLQKAGLFEEVKDRLHEPGTGLSGGQQQRES